MYIVKKRRIKYQRSSLLLAKAAVIQMKSREDPCQMELKIQVQ